MSLLGKRWEPDGLDALTPGRRMALSIVVTGAIGFLLEYIGTEVLHAFTNTSPYTIYAATAVWAFLLGPLLIVLRKAKLIVPMLIVGSVFAFLVLFNHNYFIIWNLVEGNFKDTGLLWQPRIWEFKDGQVFGIRHPLLIALVAGAIETVVVPASLWTQRLLTRGLRKKEGVPIDEVERLFENSVTPVEKFKVKRGFGFFFMRFIVFAYGIYFVYQIVGLLVSGKGLPLLSIFFLNPTETLNTFMKITLMLSLATVGAFNADVRREASILLLIGHAFSVGASLWLYLAYPVNPLYPDHHNLLLSSVAGDGVLIVVLIGLIIKLKPYKSEMGIEDIELRSPASTLLRGFFLVFGCIFTIYTIGIVVSRITGDPESGLGAVFGNPDPLVSNSVTKYGTVAALSLFLFKNPAVRRFFMPTLVTAFMVTVIGTIAFGLQGDTVMITRVGTVAILPWFMMFHIIVDGGALVLMLALRRLQYHVDYQVTSLKPTSAECVMALHRSLREEHQQPAESAREVLRRIDDHIVEIRGRRRGLLSFPFWLVEHVFPFLLWLRPPFSTMSRQEQRWMLRRYMLRPNYERAKSVIPPFSELMYQIGDVAHALVTLGYFSSPTGQRQIGYVPPDARGRLQPEIAELRPPDNVQPPPLPQNADDPAARRPLSDPKTAADLLAPHISIPRDSGGIPDEVDYCIIGSGAGGGVAAYRLAAAKGKDNSICVVERGGYYSPRLDFSDDEMRMIRMLYTEGGLQISRSFDFTILQGECVGGTTVINNAICFRMPEVSRKEWEQFGVNAASLDAHYELVRSEINISPVRPETVNHHVEDLFTRGVAVYNNAHNGMGRLSPVARIHGNFSNCVGCGLCNIGCRRMRKLSVLETYIPWAVALGVNVVANVGAVQCETETIGDKKRVTAVIVRDANGVFRKIRVRKAVVLAAGVIASSRFLLRSELGGEGVGQGISCNYAVPPLVEFPDSINAFDGLQMSLFAAPDSHEAIFEVTFNTPGTYAIATPLYLDRHASMMRGFTRSVNFTALVGSDPNGMVSRNRDLLFGRAIQWQQTDADVKRIKRSLATVIQIAQGAGARRILLPTHPVLEVPLDSTTRSTIEAVDRVLVDRHFFNFVTAHPQGGNMMAGEGINERVVDTDFRVRDCENLYVSDASVFPRGVRVNPQWTIMAIASAAARRIAENT